MSGEREQERQRVEFFTAVSHELKTPIAIIKGQLEGMIYQVGDYKDRDTYLRHCLKTTNDMEALVKEILAAARLGGSDFRLVCTDLDFSGLLQSVCRKFLGPMEDKQIALTLAIQPGGSLPGGSAAAGKGVRQCAQQRRGLLAGRRAHHRPAAGGASARLKTPASRLPRKIWRGCSPRFTGWTNPAAATAAAAGWGCTSPKQSLTATASATHWPTPKTV